MVSENTIERVANHVKFQDLHCPSSIKDYVDSSVFGTTSEKEDTKSRVIEKLKEEGYL